MKSIFTSILHLFCLSSFNKDLEQNTIKEGPIEMTMNELNLRITTAKKPLLVYFTANWYVVCKRQKPVHKEVLCEIFFYRYHMWKNNVLNDDRLVVIND